MAQRKQTPDLLGEILTGEQPATQPRPKAQPRSQESPRKRSTKPATSRRRKPRRPKWEYLEVVFRDYRGYRPRLVNGDEQEGWKQAPVIHEYLNQLGEEGWELTGIGGRHNDEVPAYLKRPKA